LWPLLDPPVRVARIARARAAGRRFPIGVATIGRQMT